MLVVETLLVRRIILSAVAMVKITILEMQLKELLIRAAVVVVLGLQAQLQVRMAALVW